ncbi:helix-turn-helix domain-containing protein [Kribbella sancticallisti]|uniref:Helix-turn-helix domain-containing protein n=1 Tax=Kribbella sancticallisti TaxID=460087 RepID=A0ABN2CHA7_9ACTN
MEDWSVYLTPGSVERQLGLFCLGAGEQRNPPGAPPERALGCHAAVFVRRGSGHLLHGPDRVLHEVEAPALLWLFPGLVHGYRPSTPWHQSWVLFSGPATEALTRLGHLDPTTPVRRYADPRVLERAFAKLLRITRTGGRSTEVQAAAALYDLIAAAYHEPGGDVIDRLKALACRRLSIKQCADELRLTVDGLREAVRSATGSTPQEVILTTRLNEAKALLAESDLPVAAIARRVGYDDPAYFSRLFSARVGQAPRTFRRIGSISPPSSSF